MLVKEIRKQNGFIRGENVLVNIIISEIYEKHSLVEHVKYFTYYCNLSKSSPNQIVL